jgi:MFS family permease
MTGRDDRSAEVPAVVPAPVAPDRPVREGSFFNPDFRRYWSASLAAHMAFQMQTIVLGWHVLERTDSALWVGLVAGAYSLPMLVFAPFAGVLADHTRRQTLAATALAGGSLAVLGLAGLVALHVDVPWHVVALSFMVGAGFTIYGPARLALLPNLLPPKALLRASTLEYSSTRFVGFLGPAIAGLFIEVFGTARTLVFQGVLFVVAAALYLTTGRSIAAPVNDDPARFRWLSSVGDALRYLRTDPPLLALFMMSLVIVPVGMAYVKLMPVFARDVLGTGAVGLGSLVGITSLGTAVSGFAIAARGDRFRKGRAVLIAATAYGLSLIALASSRDVAVAVGILFVLGLLSGVFLTLTNVLLQSRASDAVRGRLMALYGMVWGSVPFVTLAAGVLAEVVGIAPVFAGLGALSAAACLVMAARWPALKEL